MPADWTLPIPLAPFGPATHRVPHGTVLIAQGSRERRVVWLLDGEADVLRTEGDEQILCGHLEAPGHAGLLSLTDTRRPRLAELRARGAARILEWRPGPGPDDHGPWSRDLHDLRAALVRELRAHLRILCHLRAVPLAAASCDDAGDSPAEEPRRLAARLQELERARGEGGVAEEIVQRLLLLQVAGLPGAL